MNIEFYKFEGTGNDFIMLDGRSIDYSFLTEQQVAHLCNRHFGIGADGLIILTPDAEYDFRMVYFNSDGRLSTMCGNGGRCLTAFASHLGYTGNKVRFIAVDGEHEATINTNTGNEWEVSLKMIDVTGYEQIGNDYFINTGSPHYVRFVNNTAEVDVYSEGRKVRYSDRFAAEGTNVNFISEENGSVDVRTYERGVENETLSCGTGVTASAIAAYLYGMAVEGDIYPIVTIGGKLNVRFTYNNGHFNNVWLTGPAKFVYKGLVEV
jgi:diaminopimelate epimerase